MRGFNTMYTQSDYAGNIYNELYGTTTAITLNTTTLNTSYLTTNSIVSTLLSQPPNSTYVGYSYTYSISSSYTMTTSWTNINSVSLSISNPGVYIINATFPIYYFTNNGIQTLYYALSTSPLGLDSGAIQNIYYMSQGSACTIQASLSISRVLYVSPSVNIYLIGYMSLSSPVFYITNNVPTYITYTRIA